MTESTKRKNSPIEKSPKAAGRGPDISRIFDSVGDAGADETQELLELQQYWSRSIEELRGQAFDSIEAAVDKIVSLTAERIGRLAADTATQEFMRQFLLGNEEICEILQSTLSIQDRLSIQDE